MNKIVRMPMIFNILNVLASISPHWRVMNYTGRSIAYGSIGMNVYRDKIAFLVTKQSDRMDFGNEQIIDINIKSHGFKNIALSKQLPVERKATSSSLV